MEHTFHYPQGLPKSTAVAGRMSQYFLGLPFDMARETYAKAVRIGFIQDSMLAQAKFARTLGAMERCALGPLARRV